MGTRTVVLEDGALRSHPTGWAAYQRQRDEEAEAKVAVAVAKRSNKGAKRSRDGRSAKTAARKASRLAERIETAEAELRDLEEELADPSAWSTPDKAAAASERHEASKLRLAELYEQWEVAEKAVSSADGG